MNGYQRYLDPETLAAVSGLEYRARKVVEGFLAGLHRSPYRGFSVEFAQHREYSPGDDLRHLDWRVWGRTDRLYVKQYDAETNFDAVLCLDASGSMGFGSGPMTKLEYGKLVVASLACLILMQRDSVGLRVFGGADISLQSSNSPSRAREIAQRLEHVVAGGAPRLGDELAQLAERGRRKVIVVVSDFVEDEAPLIRGLRSLHRRRHDVLLVRVLDPFEEDFPLQENTEFRGLESEGALRVEPGMLRNAYLEEFDRQTALVRDAARELDLDSLTVRTDMPLGPPLAAYLQTRRHGR